MTVSQMDTYVSQLLNDTSSNKWQQTTHRLPSLNNAQYEFVWRILAYAVQNRKAHELIGEIETLANISIPYTGYSLSDLDSPYMRNGFVNCSAILDGETTWCDYRPSPDLSDKQNYYLRGNDDMPKCYVFNKKLYIDVSTGSYPVSATLYYIREPKMLIVSGTATYSVTTCELNRLYHYLLCEMAAAKCWRLLGDESSLRKYDNIIRRIDTEIQSIALGGMIAVQSKEVDV